MAPGRHRAVRAGARRPGAVAADHRHRPTGVVPTGDLDVQRRRRRRAHPVHRRRRHRRSRCAAPATAACWSSTGRWCSTWRCGPACTCCTSICCAHATSRASPSSPPACARCRCSSIRRCCRWPRSTDLLGTPRRRAARRRIELVVPSRAVRLPLSWDDPATHEAIQRYMHGVRAGCAVVPVEHRVHPADQRSRRRGAGARHRLRRAVSGARPR